MVDSEEHKVVERIDDLIDQDRVVNFSDAVFAFAATLLVLKIDMPALTHEQISNQLPVILTHLWPSYLANIISFLVIGYYWLNHHAIFSLIRHFNNKIVWINIVFLIALSFLPFPVDLYGDYPTVKIVLAFYSGSLALVGFGLAAVWIYAVAAKLTVPLSPRHLKYYTLRSLIAPVVFAIGVPLAFIDPVITQFSWLFVIIGIVLLNWLYRYKRPSQIEKMLV